MSNDDWNTPPEILDPIRGFRAIALDPCANPTGVVAAACGIMPPDDGLAERWGDHAACGIMPPDDGLGLVFVNPPYSDVTPWIRKAAAEAARGVEIVMLLPADTSTRWFHGELVGRAAHHADAILYYRRRVKFLGANGSPKFPSLLAYWGADSARFRDHFSPHGWIVRLERRARRGRK